MPADPVKQPGKGAVGALVIEPQGAKWVEDYPAPHARVPGDQRPSRTSASILNDDGNSTFLFREQVLVMQDSSDLRFGNGSPVPFISGMEDAEDTGIKSFNYRTEPIWFRMGINPLAVPEQTKAVNYADALSNSLTGLGNDPNNPTQAP